MTAEIIDFLSTRISPPIHELKEPAPSDAEIETMIGIAVASARSRAAGAVALHPLSRRGPAQSRREAGRSGRKPRGSAFGRPPPAGAVAIFARAAGDRRGFQPEGAPEDPAMGDVPVGRRGGDEPRAWPPMRSAIAANWITNWYSDTEEGRRILGLAPHERVVGFVHIGTLRRHRSRAAAARRRQAGFGLCRPVGRMSGCSTNRAKGTACRMIRSRRSSRRGRSAGSRPGARAGETNLSPYSFFNAFSSHPFLVWFASDGMKDSASFARDSGEFVVNLVGIELARKMNASSVECAARRQRVRLCRAGGGALA